MSAREKSRDPSGEWPRLLPPSSSRALALAGEGSSKLPFEMSPSFSRRGSAWSSIVSVAVRRALRGRYLVEARPLFGPALCNLRQAFAFRPGRFSSGQEWSVATARVASMVWGHLQSRGSRVVLLSAARKFGVLPYTCCMNPRLAPSLSPRPLPHEPAPSLD